MEQVMRGSEGYVKLDFRVPTTSVGTRGKVVRASKGGKRVRGKGSEGSKGHVILGFRVPTTSVGEKGEVVRASKGVRE